MTGVLAEGSRAVLFVNHRSGRARKWLWPIVEQCRLQGIELLAVHFEIDEDHVRNALDRADKVGVTTILVAGGDGTMGTFTGYLINTRFVLGVLPAGTSNDFARSLGIPMDAARAVAVIAEGNATRVDVGKAAGRPFAHAAIIGINTEFARRAQKLRRAIGRVSYPVAALEVYRDRQAFELDLTVDGKSERFQAYEVAFINAPVYGGALELEVPDASLTGRRLGVMIVEDLRLQTVLRALPHAMTQRDLALPGIETFSIDCAIVSTSPSMAFTIDGEIEGETPATVEVLPLALRVFVPESFLVRDHTGPR